MFSICCFSIWKKKKLNFRSAGHKLCSRRWELLRSLPFECIAASNGTIKMTHSVVHYNFQLEDGLNDWQAWRMYLAGCCFPPNLKDSSMTETKMMVESSLKWCVNEEQRGGIAAQNSLYLDCAWRKQEAENPLPIEQRLSSLTDEGEPCALFPYLFGKTVHTQGDLRQDFYWICKTIVYVK